MSIDHQERSLPVGRLPESHGIAAEFAAARNAVRLFKETIAGDQELEFSASLPHIIGYIEPEEQDAFKTFVAKVTKERLGSYVTGFQHFDTLLPVTYSKLEADAEALDLFLEDIFLDRTETKAGGKPRPRAVNWHVDKEIYYLISDTQPTEFFTGNAKLDRHNEIITKNSFMMPVAAPPFAIVRQTPLTVHRSPRFERDATRTFIAISTRSK